MALKLLEYIKITWRALLKWFLCPILEFLIQKFWDAAQEFYF